MSEIQRYVDSVARQPSRRSRNEALKTVPTHLRDRVRAEVIALFAERVRKGVKR